MDGATIQARIYAGRGKAAARIGLPYRLYRPLTMAAPLGNLVTTLNAAFNAGDSTYKTPNLPGDAIWYADFDGRLALPGDYLVRVSDGQTYYVASLQQLLPIVCMDCNRSVRVSRPAPAAAVGNVGYMGRVSTAEVDVVGSSSMLWPASVLFGGKSRSAIGLPTDSKLAGWRILLPPTVTVTIQPSDIVTDDLGRRYLVGAAELTDAGWRIDAQEAHA